VDDEVLIALDVVDLEVRELGMGADGEVGRERPGGRRPDEERGRRVVDEREGDDDGRVVDVLIGETSLKVGERGGAARRVGHDLDTLVDEVLLEELAKDPPAEADKWGRNHQLGYRRPPARAAVSTYTLSMNVGSSVL
jgi:hypothetical protein